MEIRGLSGNMEEGDLGPPLKEGKGSRGSFIIQADFVVAHYGQGLGVPGASKVGEIYDGKETDPGLSDGI